MAQSAKAPIYELKGGDGIVGSQYAQVDSFAELMENLSNRLLVNIGEE
jgi:hypothetical protein